jgi:hypothetical protein
MDTISNASLQHMILDSLFISYCSVFFTIVNFARLMISDQTFRGGFHETHRNLRLISRSYYVSQPNMVLAMDFVSYDGLSIVRQDMINRSTNYVSQPYGSCNGFRQLRWVIHHKSRYD